MRKWRVCIAVVSSVACVALVFALVAGDSAGAPGRNALLDYYQPWQATPTPYVNMQQLVGQFADNKVRDAERGVMHALYRSANGDDDATPTDPGVEGAPSYASELNFMQQDLPSRRAEESEEEPDAEPAPWREEEQLQHEAAEDRVRRKHAELVAAGKQLLTSSKAIHDARQLQKSAPPGYHLAYVPNQLAKENGGRDELPFVPMPPLDEEARPGQHVEWEAPGPCMLRDGTDMQIPDAECQHHEVVDDQYPERPLLTSTFPSDHYRPDIQYPYIKGPYYHHLVDGNDNQYQGYSHGHWVWKPLGRWRRQQPPPRGSYAEWFADFRNPNNDGRYGQGYAQDGR